MNLKKIIAAKQRQKFIGKVSLMYDTELDLTRWPGFFDTISAYPYVRLITQYLDNYAI